MFHAPFAPGASSSVLPGARAPFLACPRKGAKRRTPRRLGPSGLIAAAISLANGEARTGRFDATSCRGEPRAAVPGGPTLRFPAREARRKGAHPSIAIARHAQAACCLWVFAVRMSQEVEASIGPHSGRRRFAPFRLASRPAAGRGRSDMDVAPRLSATRRRVEPAPSQPSVVRPRRPEGPSRRGVLLFGYFLGQARKYPRAPGTADDRCHTTQPACETSSHARSVHRH